MDERKIVGTKIVEQSGTVGRSIFDNFGKSGETIYFVVIHIFTNSLAKYDVKLTFVIEHEVQKFLDTFLYDHKFNAWLYK